MNNLHRSPLAWAAVALAFAAGSLVAQDGDVVAQKTKLVVEALKAQEEGDLQAAKAKFEAILAIDAKDLGATEGLKSINDDIARAEAAKKAAEAPKAEAPKAEAPVAEAPKVDEAAAKAAKQAAAQGLVAGLAKANYDELDKQGDVVSSAESLIRQGTAESIDKALAELAAADRNLEKNTTPFSNSKLKERIKEARGSALARRALVAIEARDTAKAAAVIDEYAALKGKDDASVVRLQKEFASKRNDPTYRNVDEMSPGLRAKDDKVNELLVKGRARYLYGDYQGALDAYREVLQYQPNNSESKAYQIRIRQMLSENSGQWNRGVTKGKLLELLDETWKLPEVFNRENTKTDTTGGSDPVIEKMKNISLPEGFRVRDQPMDRALRLLGEMSQTYDKEQKGVEIIRMGPPEENIATELELRLKTTVYDALNVFCKRYNYSFTINSGIVEVRKDAGDTQLEIEFFELLPGAVSKMTGANMGAAAGATGGGAVFGGAAAGAAGPGGGNDQEEKLKGFFVRSGVPFEGEATMSFDGSSKLTVKQTRKNIDRIRNILRRYTEIKQVHIEAKFIEVEQKVLNELGVNWTLAPTAGGTGNVNAATNLRSINSVFAANNATVRSLNVTGNPAIPQPAPNFPGGINLGNTNQSYTGTVGIIGAETLGVAIRAIEESAGSDLMSSPSITVTDTKTAVIKVAQILRYPQAYGDTQSNVGTASTTGAGGSSTSVAITAGTPQDFQEKEVGVILDVTPTCSTTDDSINLILKPKVTEFEGFVEYGGTSIAISGAVTVSVPSGFFQPIFSIREVQTEVTVFDGATVVIGGLTREEVKTVDDKVPVLGSIPLLGAAFRSSGKTIQKKSLMVFVTPNVVSPGGATLRSNHPGMRAGSTFSNPTLISPGGAVYREPIEAAVPAVPVPSVAEPAK